MSQSKATSPLSNPCVDLTYNPACHYTPESFASAKRDTIACRKSSTNQTRKQRSVKATERPLATRPKKRSQIRHGADCTPVFATVPLEEPKQEPYTPSSTSSGLLTDSLVSDSSPGQSPEPLTNLPPCTNQDFLSRSFECRKLPSTSRPPDFVAGSEIRTLGLGVQHPTDLLLGSLPPQNSVSLSHPPADSQTCFDASQSGGASSWEYSHAPSKGKRNERVLTPGLVQKRSRFSEEYWCYIWGILDLFEAGSVTPSPEIWEERNGFTIISGQVLDATIRVAKYFGLILKREVVQDGKCVLATRTFRALHFAMTLEQAATTGTQNIGGDLPSLSLGI
ncbi:hypothetical protein BKA70DRAFT_1406864 [Coprinopsis sp. MPI-PUGE-AT-0042]|nr:hypothetical protein BKA70DRAFT_1406864 [Coprinopsis sp. MPI-PUGE-AT-0042]